MATTDKITTAEQLLAVSLPRCELVGGELIVRSPAGFDHGRIVSRIVAALQDHVARHELGVVTTAGAGFQLAHDPDTVRVPDAAFVRADNLPPGSVRGFFHGPPDLAVEVVAFGDRANEVDAKVQDWLQAGCLLVWVVDSEHQTVAIHGGSTEMSIVGPTDTLTGGELLPEFSMPVAGIFA